MTEFNLSEKMHTEPLPTGNSPSDYEQVIYVDDVKEFVHLFRKEIEYVETLLCNCDDLGQVEEGIHNDICLYIQFRDKFDKLSGDKLI